MLCGFADVSVAVPPDGFALATTDRDLYAPWLFEALVEADLHPLIRIRTEGCVGRETEPAYRPLGAFCSHRVPQRCSKSAICSKATAKM